MSKPISFGFSKPKAAEVSVNLPTSKPGIAKTMILPSNTNVRISLGTGLAKSKPAALRDDSEDEDEAPPKHEELTGFSSSGAILSKPKEGKTERVIENSGNSDWRKRGKNLLPVEVQAAQNGNNAATVERDEVSKAYGLQFADRSNSEHGNKNGGDTIMQRGIKPTALQPPKKMTDDECALAALLEDGTGRSKSTATIEVASNTAWQQRSEADDFRADVATRPESATLDEYAAMPVEEFGMAMLRGMGRKRRANGEVIDLNKNSEVEEQKRKERPTQQGLLGIGAKPVKGLEGVELGAWGKSDMRKNARGEGFFTPVMIEDKRTGERITEEEFERRKKTAKSGGEQDWRDRRDRNLERTARDHEGANDSGQVDGPSRKRYRDERDRDSDHNHRSRRDRDRERKGGEPDYDGSRSRRDRSRSRDRWKDEDARDRERRRGRYENEHKYAEDGRHVHRNSRRSEYRHRDGERHRDNDDREYRDSR